MQKRSQRLQIVNSKTFNDIPKLKKGQVLLTPESSLLMDDSCIPYENLGNWPDWWKALSGDEGSLKRCSGTSDYLSVGFTIPLWAKLMFRPSLDGTRWETQFDLGHSKGDFGIEGFGYGQTGECPVTKVRKIQKANYIKVINPWLIKTAPGWSCLFLPPLWDPNSSYTMLPAVVHTDYYHHANMVMNILTDEPFEIEIGTPIWHIIPFERSKSTEILWGDESTYALLNHRGFGGPFMPRNQKSKYKKMQREVDQSIASEKKTFFKRFLH